MDITMLPGITAIICFTVLVLDDLCMIINRPVSRPWRRVRNR